MTHWRNTLKKKRKHKRLFTVVPNDVEIRTVVTPANGDTPYTVTLHKSRFLAGQEDDIMHVTDEGKAHFAEDPANRLHFWNMLEKMAIHDTEQRKRDQ